MKRSMIVLAAAAASTQLGATNCGSIIKDPGFDLWCGDRLCTWKIERGDAVRVPTWHTGDDGVEMVGADVVISQATPVTSDDSDCIEFSMLTDVDESAEVHLQFDVFGDGTVDYDERIPTARWQPVSYLVRFAKPYNGITFRLIKQGGGHAVLAEIKAETSHDCAGTTVVPVSHPNGSYCNTATDCDSGVCTGGGGFFSHGKCESCSTTEQCAAGTVCGVDDAVPPWLDPYAACIPPATRQLGELCVGDAECATGVCNAFACSTCDLARPCASGEACAAVAKALPRPDGTQGAWPTPPSECSAAQGRRAAGEICFRDADCASARCNGPTLSVCDGDGRTCTSDLDCPENSQLEHTLCLAVGIAGGTCQ